MAQLRGIRLINAVANGTVSGAELETFLQDAGRLTEFTEIISQRGQAQRIANGQTTMDAIVLSLAAKNAIFIQAKASNSTTVEAVVKSSIAMGAVAASIGTLENVSDNPTAWGFFILSDYYEANILNIVANYAGVNPATHNNISELILDSTSIADVAVDSRAMRAVVASLSTVIVMAGNSVAMTNVADDTAAITIVAETSSIMPTVASKTQAMNEIVSRAIPMNRMSINAGAIQAIGANPTAWANFKSSAHFSNDLKDVVANLAGLNPSDYVDVNALIASATALTAIAANAQASDALSTSSAATTTLASSPNLSIILGSLTAMTYYGTEANIQAFLTVPAAVSVVFGSSVAKSIIVASDTLIDFIAATSSITTYLSGISTTAIPSNLNAVGTNNVFGGFPDKFIILSIRANNIGAIAMDFTLAGSPLAGTTYSNILSPSGTVTVSAVLGLSNPATWKASGIAATAAASPETKYVDMT